MTYDSNITGNNNLISKGYTYHDFTKEVGADNLLIKSIFDRADKSDNEERVADGYYTPENNDSKGWKNLIKLAKECLKKTDLAAQNFLDYKPIKREQYKDMSKVLYDKNVPYKNLSEIKSWLKDKKIDFDENTQNSKIKFSYNGMQYEIDYSGQNGIITTIKDANGTKLQEISYSSISSSIRDNTQGTIIVNYKDEKKVSSAHYPDDKKLQSVKEYKYEGEQLAKIVEDIGENVHVTDYSGKKPTTYGLNKNGKILQWNNASQRWEAVNIYQ